MTTFTPLLGNFVGARSVQVHVARGLNQGLLKYLGAVAIAFSLEAVNPCPHLLRVPTDLLEDTIESVEDGDAQSEDRRRLLALLAHDPRAAIRVRVAEAVPTIWAEQPEAANEQLRGLARDSLAMVRAAAARALGELLSQASHLERIATSVDWATSDDALDREAIATALSEKTHIMFRDMLIARLSTDTDALVRERALQAAIVHAETSRPTYLNLANNLASDPIRRVRRAARRLRRKVV